MAPAETTFLKQANGGWSGTYFWEEGHAKNGSTRREQGTLRDCKWSPASATIACTWKDFAGSGRFEAKFSDNLTSFEGTWGNAQQTFSGHHWNGKKS
jgi:hypothetical protein